MYYKYTKNMKEILDFKNITDKPNTLISIVLYNYNTCEFIDFINHCLEKIKMMKNKFRQKTVNNRLFNLRCFIEDKNDEKLSSIILVNDEIYEYKLNKKELATLEEYNIRDLYFKYDEIFHIDYIYNLFNDFNFYNVYELCKKKLDIYNINSTKSIKLDTITINNQNELDDIISKADLVHGNSTYLKKINLDNVFNRKLCSIDIIDEINKIKTLSNHIKLRDILDGISDPKIVNKLIFGRKESRKYTRMSMLKILFIHENFYDIFTTKQKDYINFDIIQIKNLKHGDISSEFLSNYGGFIGELYYPL